MSYPLRTSIRQCILETFWLSSEDNELVDHLSRDREWEFFRDAVRSGFWVEGTLPLRHASAGAIRQLPDQRGLLRDEIFTSTPQEHEDEFKPIGTEVRSIATGTTRSLLRLRGAGPPATSQGIEDGVRPIGTGGCVQWLPGLHARSYAFGALDRRLPSIHWFPTHGPRSLRVSLHEWRLASNSFSIIA